MYEHNMFSRPARRRSNTAWKVVVLKCMTRQRMDHMKTIHKRLNKILLHRIKHPIYTCDQRIQANVSCIFSEYLNTSALTTDSQWST